MSVTDAYDQNLAEHADRMARSRELARCYRVVFWGQPQPADQEAVREDLEAFCGLRSGLMRGNYEDTAHAIGQFRVWQRIHSFCFPREVDRPQQGANHGTPPLHQPIPGGGIVDRTSE